MTPEEQHAWGVIKALAEDKPVQFKDSYGQWCQHMKWFDKYDVRDIIANPHLYRIAQEGEE